MAEKRTRTEYELQKFRVVRDRGNAVQIAQGNSFKFEKKIVF